MKTKMSQSEILRLARLHIGYSQQDVARELGVESMSKSQVSRLCAALDEE